MFKLTRYFLLKLNLLRRTALSEKHSLSGTAHRSAESLWIINDVLDFPKIEVGKLNLDLVALDPLHWSPGGRGALKILPADSS